MSFSGFILETLTMGEQVFYLSCFKSNLKESKMKNFIKGTIAILGIVATSVAFLPQAQAFDWVISPDANTNAFGVTVVNGVAQIGIGDTSQPTGIYGAGFSMTSDTGLLVGFDADLYSWDSYNAPAGSGTGYWDAFIVTISTLGYYWDTPQSDPIASSANTFVWGGQNYADGILESYTTAPGGMDYVQLLSGAATYYVSIVLDTKTLPNADTNHPSYGSFHVSVVPEPETYAMMLAGLGLIFFTVRRRKDNHFEGNNFA